MRYNCSDLRVDVEPRVSSGGPKRIWYGLTKWPVEVAWIAKEDTMAELPSVDKSVKLYLDCPAALYSILGPSGLKKRGGGISKRIPRTEK